MERKQIEKKGGIRKRYKRKWRRKRRRIENKRETAII